jgi:hypothetical protein
MHYSLKFLFNKKLFFFSKFHREQERVSIFTLNASFLLGKERPTKQLPGGEVLIPFLRRDFCCSLKNHQKTKSQFRYILTFQVSFKDKNKQ